MALSSQRIVLIDGSSYLYRAFHALPSLSNTKGEPTGAIYGVIGMIKKLLVDYAPDYIAVVFDPKGKTQRHAIYSEYKAQRPSMPPDLSIQVKYIFEIIAALGLPIIMEDGIEADDVIGTLAIEATQLGLSTLISTGDKDMAQLVNDSVTLINTMSNTVYDRSGVIKKFGVSPEQIVDYLSLVGDSVDNIPGVPNVGPKTAAKWLKDYHSLENIIEQADHIKGKVGENLKQALPFLSLAKKLATIRVDLKLSQSVLQLTRKEPQLTRLIELYKQLEFKAWLAELLQHENYHEHENYAVINEEKVLDQWIADLQKSEIYALKLETTHRDAMQSELIGIAFALAPKQAIYIPLAHDYDAVPLQLDFNVVLKKLVPLFVDTTKTLVGEDVKIIVNVLLRYGVEVKNILCDTLLESYVQNSASTKHDINTLALKYLGRRTITYEDVMGKGAKQIAANKVAIEKIGQYAAESADVVLQLHHIMSAKIVEDNNLARILTDVEIPLTRVLARMEYTGVLINAAMLVIQSKELAKKIVALEEEAFAMAGCRFNLSSPKQLQTIFYEKLQLPVLNKTPTGQASTSEATLQELAHDYSLPRVVLDYRGLVKIKTTYTDRLPLQINPNTHRVHTCYNQAVTTTGRLSSTDPNLQNIPIKSEEGRRIRQAFIAAPGHKILSADYSQIELRLMAHLSQDPGLLRAFEQNQDIHTATAAELFNVNINKVTSQQRRSAKAINFGLIYGMSAFGLARQLGIDRNLAQNYIDRYFARYANVRIYMETTKQFAHEYGYVETFLKHRLYLPEIKAVNLPRRKAAERAAINAPLQGSAAEIIKVAMVNLDQWLQASGSKAKMIMQVHDELVFEVPEAELDKVREHVVHYMTHACTLDVPLSVGVGVGSNWDEAH